MRFVVARRSHVCAGCKEIISIDEVCIQAESTPQYYYHMNCHFEKFGFEPKMTKTARRMLDRNVWL